MSVAPLESLAKAQYLSGFQLVYYHRAMSSDQHLTMINGRVKDWMTVSIAFGWMPFSGSSINKTPASRSSKPESSGRVI